MAKFLDRNGFPPVGGIIGIQGSEDLIDSGHENPSEAMETAGAALAHRNEVVHKDVNIAKDTGTVR